jgi:membrane protein
MRDYLRQFFKAIADDSIDTMSSSIAYAFMLSLFPFLIGIFAILQLLQQSANIVESLIQIFEDFLPGEVQQFILDNFNNVSYQRTGSILVISLIASVGFGSYGFRTIFSHLSRIMRDDRPRSFIWMAVLPLIFAAAAILIIAISFVLLMLSGDIIRKTSAKLNLADYVPYLLNILRYPFVLIFLVFSAAIVYRVGPKRKMPVRSILASSLCFSCGWVIATYIFGLYIQKFAVYNQIFGALAGVIIFLMWMYLSAFIFLSSAEIGRMHMEHYTKKMSGTSKKPHEIPERENPENKHKE